MSSALQVELSGWNGQSTADLESIYQRTVHRPEFRTELIQAIADPRLERGATWLLKHHLELGGELDASESALIFPLIPKLRDWESKLHILQSLSDLVIPSDQVSTIQSFLNERLNETNKFVRAWAYHGQYELALQYPEFRVQTTRLLENGLKEESAAVRARIRRVLKQGFD